MILLLRHTVWVLIFCALGVILSILAMIKGDFIPEERWEPTVTERSVITVTPLDSPNSCYLQDFYGRVE